MPATALRACPDCGHSISDLAEACPSCGRPLKAAAPREGLFLRTMNHGTKLVFGILLFVVVFPIVIAIVGYLLFH
jgi:predicted amidophosphoribosyltransferase